VYEGITMTKSLMQSDRDAAKKKGVLAAGAAAGTAAVFLLTPLWPLGVIGLAGTGYLTWDWFKFRAKRGMRF
jgi:hypothetical protein